MLGLGLGFGFVGSCKDIFIHSMCVCICIPKSREGGGEFGAFLLSATIGGSVEIPRIRMLGS